jgi:hypothetical protein
VSGGGADSCAAAGGLSEFTATPEFRLSPHALVRADLRVDRSTKGVFDARTGATKTQPTLQFNFLHYF